MQEYRTDRQVMVASERRNTVDLRWRNKQTEGDGAGYDRYTDAEAGSSDGVRKVSRTCSKPRRPLSAFCVILSTLQRSRRPASVRHVPRAAWISADWWNSVEPGESLDGT